MGTMTEDIRAASGELSPSYLDAQLDKIADRQLECPECRKLFAAMQAIHEAAVHTQHFHIAAWVGVLRGAMLDPEAEKRLTTTMRNFSLRELERRASDL
jgi:hypothetical protein